MDTLERWQELEPYQNGFIRDGIIDPSRWQKAPRRVCFLLKEAYGERPLSEADPAVTNPAFRAPTQTFT